MKVEGIHTYRILERICIDGLGPFYDLDNAKDLFCITIDLQREAYKRKNQ